TTVRSRGIQSATLCDWLQQFPTARDRSERRYLPGGLGWQYSARAPGVNADGTAQAVTVFASGLNNPFGIAFYPSGSNPQSVYVANTNSVVRFPYQNGDS